MKLEDFKVGHWYRNPTGGLLLCVWLERVFVHMIDPQSLRHDEKCDASHHNNVSLFEPSNHPPFETKKLMSCTELCNETSVILVRMERHGAYACTLFDRGTFTGADADRVARALRLFGMG